jgi:hypothetical protein
MVKSFAVAQSEATEASHHAEMVFEPLVQGEAMGSATHSRPATSATRPSIGAAL